MKLPLATLALALLAGYLAGGRLSNLAELRIRLAPLALIGFALQLVNPPGDWPLVMLLTSFVLLTVVAIANLRVTGFAIILVGVLMNFAVIAVNAGMPVSHHALVASGQLDTISGLTNDADGYVKHHLANEDDRLLFLGDVIPLAPPMSQAVSIGDVFTYGGVAVVVAAAMRGTRRRDPLPEVVPGVPG